MGKDSSISSTRTCSWESLRCVLGKASQCRNAFAARRRPSVECIRGLLFSRSPILQHKRDSRCQCTHEGKKMNFIIAIENETGERRREKSINVVRRQRKKLQLLNDRSGGQAWSLAWETSDGSHQSPLASILLRQTTFLAALKCKQHSKM